MTTPSRSAWRDRRFRVFALGNGINSVGEGMYALAIPLLVFQLTGSLEAMALLASVYPLVITVSGPLLGIAVDRFGANSFVLSGLSLQVAAALALNLVLLAGPPDLWILCLAEALVQLGAVTYRAGWMAGLPSMFPTGTSKARGAMLTTYQATVVVGPALTAVLIVPLGISGVLWLNLLTFLAPILVWCAGIRPERRSVDVSVRWRPAQDLLDGWRTVRASGQVPVVMFVLVPLNLVFSMGTISLLLFYLRDGLEFSPRATGLVLVVTNVAALIGAAYTAERFTGGIPVVSIVGLAGSGLCLVVIPVTQLAAVVIVAAMTLYALNSMLEVAAEMVLYENVPAAALGRTLGLYRMLLGMPTIVSPLVIAAAAQALGTTAAFWALAILALAPALWLVATRGRVLKGEYVPRPGSATDVQAPSA